MTKDNHSPLLTMKTLFAKEEGVSIARFVFLCIAKALFIFIVLWLCVSQVSTLLDYNLNKINYILIGILFLLYLGLDFRLTFYHIIKLIPFLAFLIPLCLTTGLIGKNTFLPELVSMTILSGLMFLMSLLAKNILFKKQSFKFLCAIYIVGCLAFCAIALIVDNKTLLDFSSSTYSYFSKNSAAPMLCCSLIFIPYVFDDHSKWQIIVKAILYIILVGAIVLLRCRSVLICLPIIFIYNIYRCDYESNEKWVWIISLCLGAVALFAIPQLRNMIIKPFISSASGGTSIDDVSSGRLSQLVNAFSGFRFINVLFGKGIGYIDIMPAYLVCYYGLFGFLIFTSIIALVTYLVFAMKNGAPKEIMLILLLFYFINSLFEAYGMFGPGAKVFALWSIFGFAYDNVGYSLLNKFDSIDKKVISHINSISPNFVNAAFISTLAILFIPICLISSINTKASTTLYSFIPINGKNYEVIKATDVSIETGSSSKIINMEVGEKITLNATVLPDNTLDKKLYWSTYQPTILSVNKDTGEIEALNEGYATLVCYINNNRSVLDDSVKVLVEKSKGMAREVTLTATTSTSISKNQSVGFDWAIEPNCLNVDDFSICTDNETAIKINNSTKSIVGISNNVQANVWGEYLNRDGTITKSNVITIKVDNNTLDECTSISVNTTELETVYSKEPIFLKATFNNNCDHNYRIAVSSNNVIINDNDSSIRFLQPGIYDVSVVSLFDPSVSWKQQINVAENKVTQIYCSNDWSIVGKINTIDVRFQYESGYRELANPIEYAITVSGTKYAESIADSNEYFAKANGTFSGRVILKEDQNIFTWYEITNHPITKEQFQKTINLIKMLVCVLLYVFIVALLILLTIFKKRKVDFVIKIISICIVSSVGLVSSALVLKSIFATVTFAILFPISTAILLIFYRKIKQLSLGTNEISFTQKKQYKLQSKWYELDL